MKFVAFVKKRPASKARYKMNSVSEIIQLVFPRSEPLCLNKHKHLSSFRACRDRAFEPLNFVFDKSKQKYCAGALLMRRGSMKFSRLLIALAFGAYSISTSAVQEGVIAPPDVKVMDFMNVNMATGQVEQSLNTLDIGGDYGISHSISLYTNFFDAEDGKGYRDKFSGMPHYTTLSEEQDGYLEEDANGIVSFAIRTGTNQTNQIWVIRVSGPNGSQDFAYKQNGNLLKSAEELDTSSSYTYVAIGDKRHSLMRMANGDLIWRNPEGVETKYIAGKAGIESITYPNGFKIYVDYRAVWTNTGYMLKYDIADTYYNTLTNGYWAGNPKSITALNLAYEHCSSDKDCATTGWPKASFNWPTGTPGSFYIENALNVFSVTDQYGGVTDFHYETQNACRWRIVDESGLSGYCLDRNPGIKKYAPRLVGIKSATSNVVDMTYSYENVGENLVNENSSGSAALKVYLVYWNLHTKNGRVHKVSKKNHHRTYGEPLSSDQYNYSTVRENSGNRVQIYNYQPGVLESVMLRKKGTYNFEANSRNFVTDHTPVSGPAQSFYYDDASGGRGNLERVVTNGVNIQQADYPSSCTESNYRYCNKPIWLKDAKNNRTDYTYHQESGQIATATSPAITIKGASVRPKTTYVYDEYHATFYHYNSGNGSFSLKQSEDGMWLLRQEWACNTSNALVDSVGCSGGAQDLIKKDYYYGPQDGSQVNNLLLRGESVTAYNHAGFEETRITCYEYNKYGKQIGVTPPKGNISIASAAACP